jgi:mono/diheme cytochrome c family protein
MRFPPQSAPALRAAVLAAGLLAGHAAVADPAWTTLDQGAAWTAERRADFYSRDQGSRIMPLRWMAALRQASGAPFMEGSLSRYGYLPNEESTPAGLPVGFTVASAADGETLGMTCAACHTRQIAVQGRAYRIDGGPAIVDFQAFLSDLHDAVARTRQDPVQFAAFAGAVLGPAAGSEPVAALRAQLDAWYLPYDAIITGALPQPPWGPGRLDAVTMIFDRLTGLDLGPPPSYLIPGNIKRADAPVRYPFLWNAARQDKTQWPGFADNGNAILGLARNLGEVTGVFAVYHPKKDEGRLLGINYVSENSANFEGLAALERLIRRIGPPRWPWPVDAALAEQGRALFAQNCAGGCHEVRSGALRSLLPEEATWTTPVMNVGTDTREWAILGRSVDPGVLTGAAIPGFHEPLRNPEAPINVLGLSVVGSILQHAFPVVVPDDLAAQFARAGTAFTPATESLKGAFRNIDGQGGAPAGPGAYESRVLQGIWAAAPYLHNGSVPSLAELLKPASQRVASFKLGPNYDLATVGLAADQSAFAQPRQTTGCEDLDSGSSRCGHEFGTALTPAQKQALLEYLKTL